VSMTRRDFQALADALAESHPAVTDFRAGIEAGGLARAARAVQWQICADAITGVCRRSNPNFDPDRFARAILVAVDRLSRPSNVNTDPEAR
jgi:hypothetical protein